MSRKILLVDNDPDVLQLTAILLRGDGFEVRVAASAAEALTSAFDFVPDVVCLDLGMPGMSGYELASRLRKVEGLSRVCLVAVSGCAADGALLDLAGIDRHVLKPLELLDLKLTICELLLKRHSLPVIAK